MNLNLNFIDVLNPPIEYGRYVVLVATCSGDTKIVTADYYHPPGAYSEGWFDSQEYDADPVNAIAWANLPLILKK